MNYHVENIKRLISRNSSDLLLVSGVACILGSGVLAVKQTPKAVRLLEKKKESSTIDKIKIAAPLYVPSVLLAGFGIAQIVCSRNISNNKIAAITTAYTVSETALRTYKEKVKEVVEPEKYERIKKEVASDILKGDPSGNKEVIISSKGEELIYDAMSGRYFRGSMEEVDRAVNILNKRLMTEMTINLNEFYSEINLPIVKVGCELGWSIEKELIDVHITSGITEDGRPCLVLDYDVVPLYRY